MGCCLYGIGCNIWWKNCSKHSSCHFQLYKRNIIHFLSFTKFRELIHFIIFWRIVDWPHVLREKPSNSGKGSDICWARFFCFSGRFLWLCYDKCPCSCLPFFSPNSSWWWNIFAVSLTLLYLYSFWQFLVFIMQHVFSNCRDFWLPCGKQKSSSLHIFVLLSN